eukprot:6297002-Amphidinium_carterae.1
MFYRCCKVRRSQVCKPRLAVACRFSQHPRNSGSGHRGVASGDLVKSKGNDLLAHRHCHKTRSSSLQSKLKGLSASCERDHMITKQVSPRALRAAPILGALATARIRNASGHGTTRLPRQLIGSKQWPRDIGPDPTQPPF